MGEVKMFSGVKLPLEMHKVRVVQKLNLLPVEARQKAMAEAGNNTFLLRNDDVFLDIMENHLIPSGTDKISAMAKILFSIVKNGKLSSVDIITSVIGKSNGDEIIRELETPPLLSLLTINFRDVIQRAQLEESPL